MSIPFITSCISGRSVSQRLSIIHKILNIEMEAKLSKTHYSPQGYWHQKDRRRGKTSLKKLLIKQALWQIYLYSHKHIRRPKFDVSTSNTVHQADLFLAHETTGRCQGRKTYKYALTVVDVASRFKEAELLTSKDSTEVTRAFRKNYDHGPLKSPQLLRIYPGREIMGVVNKEMEKHKTNIRRGCTEIH